MARTITVGTTNPDAGDILDYATGLIEEFGWNKMNPADPGANRESSEETGYTLHDAIGAACTRLSTAIEGRGSKDWTIRFDDNKAVNLRQEATRLVTAHLPDGLNDQQFNDQAASVDDVLAVLRQARAEVPA